jgi:hypothetical protein
VAGLGVWGDAEDNPVLDNFAGHPGPGGIGTCLREPIGLRGHAQGGIVQVQKASIGGRSWTLITIIERDRQGAAWPQTGGLDLQVVAHEVGKITKVGLKWVPRGWRAGAENLDRLQAQTLADHALQADFHQARRIAIHATARRWSRRANHLARLRWRGSHVVDDLPGQIDRQFFAPIERFDQAFVCGVARDVNSAGDFNAVARVELCNHFIS